MKSISETIVFFGSGPVAAKSLELLTKEFTIEVVITKPRPPHHKGDVPVLDISKNLGLQVQTASNKQELDDLMEGVTFSSKLAILIDFGIIVSQKTIDKFSLGIINSHFSLLPRWRGADPISFSILSGDTKTGVSLMIIDTGMDTGKLITQKSYNLPKNITTPELTINLIELSDQLIKKYIPLYLSKQIKPNRQPHPDRATYSRKLTKADSIINWEKPAKTIEQEIRAFVGWPGSQTNILNKTVIITQSHLTKITGANMKVGEIYINKPQGILVVKCGQESYLAVDKIKPADKREMTIKDFLLGYAR